MNGWNSGGGHYGWNTMTTHTTSGGPTYKVEASDGTILGSGLTSNEAYNLAARYVGAKVIMES